MEYDLNKSIFKKWTQACLYLIGPKDVRMQTGQKHPLKLGRTVSLKRRIASFRTCFPFGVRVYAIMDVRYGENNYILNSVERQVQAKIGAQFGRIIRPDSGRPTEWFMNIGNTRQNLKRAVDIITSIHRVGALVVLSANGIVEGVKAETAYLTTRSGRRSKYGSVVKFVEAQDNLARMKKVWLGKALRKKFTSDGPKVRGRVVAITKGPEGPRFKAKFLNGKVEQLTYKKIREYSAWNSDGILGKTIRTEDGLEGTVINQYGVVRVTRHNRAKKKYKVLLADGSTRILTEAQAAEMLLDS